MKLARYVKFREEKFGGVLFETRSEKVFTLNPTGAAIVREIGQGGPESDVIVRVKDGFHDRGEAIERETTEFIAQLRDRGLVED